MILSDENIFNAFYEYSINGIVIFLIDSLTQLKDNYDSNEDNENEMQLIYYEKTKEKEEMETEVNRKSFTCREILVKIFEDKKEGKFKFEDYIVSDIFEKAQMEIITKRRELLGQNIKYLEKESEIKFETRRIKYLRRALMIIKMNT